MCIRPILLILIPLYYSVSVNADVLTGVDERGKSHYSSDNTNTNNKSSRNKASIIKLDEYKAQAITPPRVSISSNAQKTKENTAVLMSGDGLTDVLNDQDSATSKTHRIILKDLDRPKSYTRHKSRNTQRTSKSQVELTIAELNQRCEEAREELIAPLRQEAILVCMKMKNSMTTRTRDYCEVANDNFGDGGMNSEGYYIQRMFHNIPECLQMYEAWNRNNP